MNQVHPEVGPELRMLARQFLAIIDPAWQAFLTVAATPERSPGKCQQVWCPVCAAAALASGDQHPLGSMIAEHGTAVLALLRAVVDSGGAEPSARGARSGDAEPASPASKYEHIPVTVFD